MRDRRELAIELKNTDLVQHTEPDVRFYEDEATGKNYPSVTTILDLLPKDPFLEMWKDKNGAEAVNNVLYKASVSGTKVHNEIDRFCQEFMEDGEASMFWFDEFGNKRFDRIEWEMLIKFVDFFDNFVEEVILSEARMKSDELFVSGTVDGVLRLTDGRVVVIDYKTSNTISDKFSVQSWCYAKMVEENYGLEINGRGNLWLKAHTRGRDKSGKKIQGAGWSFVEHTENERDEKVFKCAHDLFMDQWRNKTIAPSHKVYPTILNVKKK